MQIGRLAVLVAAMAGLVAGATVGAGQKAAVKVAATPPMGWNSWDAYGLTITEEQFRANVGVLAGKLKPFGTQFWTQLRLNHFRAQKIFDFFSNKKNMTDVYQK